MRKDGSQVRRQSGSGIPTRATTIGPRERRHIKRREQGATPMSDISPDADADLNDEVFGDEKPAVRKKSSKETQVTTPEIIDDDEVTVSLVNSINAIAEMYEAFVLMNAYMDAQTRERTRKYLETAEMVKPDTEDGE